MKLIELKKRMEKTPVIITGNRESLLCLDSKFEIIKSEHIWSRLDDPLEKLKNNNYVIFSNNSKCLRRFPRVGIKEPFWQLSFDEHLAAKYETAKKLFLIQSEIKKIIVEASDTLELVVLVIIDGLSYTNCLNWENVSPCLVDTLTTTEFGFKNIIGHKKNIANHLFEKGFHKFIGFSYWEKDQKNELNDVIFKGFGEVNKVQSFENILKILSGRNLKNSYIQVTTSGLDEMAHKSREKPLIDATIKQLKFNIDSLKKELVKSRVKGKMYITSDHGILWKHHKPLNKTPSDFAKDVNSPRYYEGIRANSEGKRFSAFGKDVVSLKLPYLLRELRSNEWGVHGGISLEESIIPFLTIDIN